MLLLSETVLFSIVLSHHLKISHQTRITLQSNLT